MSAKKICPRQRSCPGDKCLFCMRANTDCTSILPVSRCQLCRQSADRLLVRRASKKMAAHVKRDIGEAKGYDYMCVLQFKGFVSDTIQVVKRLISEKKFCPRQRSCPRQVASSKQKHISEKTIVYPRQRSCPRQVFFF